MRTGASDRFYRDLNRAKSPVIPFVELLRAEREHVVDTNAEWGEADSLTGVTVRNGQIRLTGTSTTWVEHATGTAETLTNLVNPVGASALSVAAVQWSGDVSDREIHAVTARLDPQAGPSTNVARWQMRVFRLYSVERDGERSTATRWHLQMMGSPVTVIAGAVQADVTFELRSPVLVGDAPIVDPDVVNAPVGDAPTVPTTIIAIWALQADGSPATNVAWVTDDSSDEKTISGHTVSRYDLDTPTAGSYAGLAFRNTGTTNGVPRFALLGGNYSPVTVSFTSNPIDLGAAPGASSRLDLVGQGRSRGGSILFEIHDGSNWLTYVDGDQVGVDRSGEGGSDLSGVSRTQTYDMRVTLTPATAGASPIVARLGVREIGASEYVFDNVIIGDATWAVDPITGASEVPEIQVTFPLDGRRDYRTLIEDTLATYHVGALQLRVWMGDPDAHPSNWLHIDDFLVDDYHTVEGGVVVTCVSPLALIKREIPEATGSTIQPVTYLADTPADIYEDLIASQLGVPARFVGQGLEAATPLLSREIVEIVQGRDALTHIARIGRAAVISSQGKLKAVPFFGADSQESDALTLFTMEETRIVGFSPGYRTRVTSAVVKFGWDAAARKFAGSWRAENTDAVNNLGRGAIDFEEQIDEELCRWFAGGDDAMEFGNEHVELFGPGLKLVRLDSAVRRPWLEPGDPIAVESDQFVGRDPVTGVGVRGPMIAYATVQAVNDVEGRDITAWIRSWEDIVPAATEQARVGFGEPEVRALTVAYNEDGDAFARILTAKAGSVKVLDDDTVFPDPTAETAVDVDADGWVEVPLSTGYLVGQDAYISVVAYELVGGGGRASGRAVAKVTRPDPGELIATEMGAQAQRFATDIVFSATDNDTVAWTSGTVTLGLGDSYSIDAGNTGNMTGLTFVYLDIDTSETVLQVTTTFGDAVGLNKILMCTARPASAGLQFAFFVPAVGVFGLNADQIGDGSIVQGKMASGLYVPVIVSSLPTLPDSDYPQGALVVLTSDNKLYRSTGSAWTAAVPSSDLSGTITETQIADDAITTPKIAANAVTADEIAANTIVAGNIAAGAIGADQIAANAVIAGKISAGAVTADKVATNAITTDKINANAVTAGKINVASLSAISADLGTVTAGTISAGIIVASESFTASSPVFSGIATFRAGEGGTRLRLDADSLGGGRLQLYRSGGTLTTQLYAVGTATWLESVGDLTLRNTSSGNVTITGGDLVLASGTSIVSGGTHVTIEQDVIVDQGAGAGVILQLRSSDVAHGMTTHAHTSAYGQMVKQHATNGGLVLRGLSESIEGLEVLSLASATTTIKSSAASAGIILGAWLKSGTTVGNISANANILAVRAGGNTRFIIDQEGDFHYDGTANTYDRYEDAKLVRALSRVTGRESVILDEFDDAVEYTEDDLVKAGILGAPLAEGGLVNGAALQRLHNGAVWQQESTLRRIERATRAIIESNPNAAERASLTALLEPPTREHEQ